MLAGTIASSSNSISGVISPDSCNTASGTSFLIITNARTSVRTPFRRSLKEAAERMVGGPSLGRSSGVKWFVFTGRFITVLPHHNAREEHLGKIG